MKITLWVLALVIVLGSLIYIFQTNIFLFLAKKAYGTKKDQTVIWSKTCSADQKIELVYEDRLGIGGQYKELLIFWGGREFNQALSLTGTFGNYCDLEDFEIYAPDLNGDPVKGQRTIYAQISWENRLLYPLLTECFRSKEDILAFESSLTSFLRKYMGDTDYTDLTGSYHGENIKLGMVALKRKYSPDDIAYHLKGSPLYLSVEADAVVLRGVATMDSALGGKYEAQVSAIVGRQDKDGNYKLELELRAEAVEALRSKLNTDNNKIIQDNPELAASYKSEIRKCNAVLDLLQNRLKGSPLAFNDFKNQSGQGFEEYISETENRVKDNKQRMEEMIRRLGAGKI